MEILLKDKKVLIDDEDYQKINNHKWYVWGDYNTIYSNFDGKTHILSRFLLNAPKDKMVDHINRNRLDNRKSNLRFCNRSQNNANSFSKNKNGYRGVYKYSHFPAYYAEIRVKKKKVYLGYFRDIKEAASAYNTAAKEYYGEFAMLNAV